MTSARVLIATRRGFLASATAAAGLWGLRAAERRQVLAAPQSGGGQGGVSRKARLGHRWREVVVPPGDIGPSHWAG